MDSSGKTHCKIEGLWNERLSLIDSKTGSVDHCLKVDPRPANSDRMYAFGTFTINLNYIDEEMKKTLPPTDTRRRPDQRYMEEGKYDLAASEKNRLEDKQRQVRKRREEQHIPYKPLYFKEVDDEISGEKKWVYLGNYWPKRKSLDYNDLPDLF